MTMKLNREQIIKALECCTLEGCHDCRECPQGNVLLSLCKKNAMADALTLITSQEQRIKELSEENERWQAVALKQEDTMQRLAREKQSYYDELQIVKSVTARKMQAWLRERVKGIYLDEAAVNDIIDHIPDVMKEEK